MNGAKWIWITQKAIAEEYVTFEKKFIFLGKTLTLKICAETNYIVYLNGKRAEFGQFPNYPDEKYFDELNLTPYAQKGENTLRITVRYEGCSSFTHIDDGAGLIFAVYDDGKQIAVSDQNTLACYDTVYVQHDPRKINFALGYACDMVNASDSVCRVPCVEQSRQCTLMPRPVRKLELTETHGAMLCDAEKNVYDIGIETAGYIYLKLRCESACTVTVVWGEHLADGDVRQKVSDYDFSLQFRCKQGENSFENFFVRLGCRYLQVKCDCAVEVETIGIYEYDYPVTVKEPALTGLDKEIYDTCVRTLRLCMHEHYEDCPWREQALYALDSRNQMLCGYRAFQETSFARANLIYISKSVNENGLLKIISPRKEECGIPFFSLMYIVAVYEYIEETGDERILDEVWETLYGIMRAFSKRNENGLILTFDEPYWNFYEWSYYSAGDEGGKEYLLLNCAYVFAAERFRKLCELRGEIFTENLAKHIATIHKSFFLPESGLYCVSTEHKDLCSQLGNAFAVLIGLGDIRTYRAIKTCEGLIECTLSMRGFVYDALLAISQKNAAYVLDDIRIRYEKMLDAGATTFWETEEGEKAFDGAGSLCHAWSAMPILYYHKLMPERFPHNAKGGVSFLKKVINILQFVRGCEPRNPEIDLYEPMRGHIALLREYGFRGTFLLQYDALIDSEFVFLAREAQPLAEIGLWLEIVQPLAERANVKWKGRFLWDWESDKGTLIAYTPSERRKMLDVAVHTFQDTFGYTPKCVGAWVLDAVSLQYLQETYGISAACNCVNQYGTDGYTLWGGNTVAYYPSKKNILSPAQTAENQINVPVFRMLGADPIYQYDWYLRDGMGIVTLEPSLSLWRKPGGGYVKDWIEWFFRETYSDKTGTPFAYAQAGQENSFGWDSMKEGLRLQCEKIAALRDQGQLETLTLSQTGEWFQKEYPLTPVLSQTALTDWHGEGQKSVWYNCRRYRVNLFVKDTLFGIRDCYLFDEYYPERYLDEVCNTSACMFDTLPLWDGMRQSKGKESALLRLCDDCGKPCNVLSFAYEQEGNTGVCTLKTEQGEFQIKCLPERMIIKKTDKAEFVLIADEGKAVPKLKITVENNRVECDYRGYLYSVSASKGRLCKNRAISESGILQIDFTRREE